MRTLAFAAAALLLAFSLPASAETTAPASTDISAQSITVGPGGVRVGHDRYDSRRRDVRIHDRFESRNRRVHDRFESRGRGGGPVCRTVTVRERLPGGGVRIIKRREC